MTVVRPPSRYTARALGALCSVSERTVRYYVQEGLLPAPAGRGRGAHFAEDHLTRLRLIRAMQQEGAELDAIREYLAELEGELKTRGASFEDALAVWNARNEQSVWRTHWRRLGAPSQVFRYHVAEGVELLVDAQASPDHRRMRTIVETLQKFFDEGEEG